MFEALLAAPSGTAPRLARMLLHFDGANGSQSIVESYGRTVTAVGQAKLSTAQFKFGGSAVSFSPAYQDRLVIPNDPGLTFDKDFTIEFWSYINDFSNYDSFPFSKNAKDGTIFSMSWIEFYQGRVYLKTEGAGQPAPPISPANALKAKQWQHIALTRVGTVYTLWIDGASVGTITSTNGFWSQDADVWIGNMLQTTSAQPCTFNGLIDEFRTVKGQAIYTTTFTPPTGPFEA